MILTWWKWQTQVKYYKLIAFETLKIYTYISSVYKPHLIIFQLGVIIWRPTSKSGYFGQKP